MEKRIKLIGALLGVILFIAAIAGLTYAYTVWQSDNIKKVVSSKCFDIYYEKGNNISGTLYPSIDYTGGLSTTMKLDIKKECNINAKGKLYLNTLDSTSSSLYTTGLLNYQVVSGSTLIKAGNITSSGEIEIDLGFLNINDSATTSYTVYVWANGEYVTNEHANAVYNGSVTVKAIQTDEEPPLLQLITHITNLYKNNYDSNYDTAFADDSGMNYFAPSVRLMNDGLDSTGAMVSSTDARNGTAGNIRYYGSESEDLKNYIYFNCSDYSAQSSSTCETWRIVGIVDGKVKIVSPSIGSYAWDEGESNDWNNASLKSILNEGGSYYTSLESKNSDTIDLISPSTWYINGMSDDDIYANAAYSGERTGTSTWPGNIALPYPSDYGYAVDLNSCNYTLYNYENCTSNSSTSYNWMYNLITSNGSNVSWLLTPSSIDDYDAWNVSGGGTSSWYGLVLNSAGVSPVLYLDPELCIESEGDGSSGNPYRLAVN